MPNERQVKRQGSLRDTNFASAILWKWTMNSLNSLRMNIVNGKVVAVEAMKAYSGNRAIALLILNLGTT